MLEPGGEDLFEALRVPLRPAGCERIRHRLPAELVERQSQRVREGFAYLRLPGYPIRTACPGARQDQRAHELLVGTCERQCHVAAHRERNDVSRATGEDFRCIVSEVGDRVRLPRGRRAAGSARVVGDGAEAPCERRHLFAPSPHRLAEPFDQEQRLAVAVLFDIEL